MPNTLRRRTHSTRKRPAAEPLPVAISTEMVVYGDNPRIADVLWTMQFPVQGSVIDAEYTLDEDGEFRVFIVRREGRRSDSFTDGGALWAPKDLAAVGRSLVALAERAEAEQAVGRRRLAEWRARREASKEPLEIKLAHAGSPA